MLGESDVRDRVWRYIKEKATLHEAVSPVGVVAHLRVPLDQAVAAFNKLEKEGKISRVHKNLMVFELNGDSESAIEIGVERGENKKSTDGEVASANVSETKKEENMPKITLERATADWEKIRNSKSFAKLGVSSVGELLKRIDSEGLEEAVPVGPGPKCVNFKFRENVKKALTGFYLRAAELDKMAVEPTTFRHPKRKRRAELVESAPAPTPPEPAVSTTGDKWQTLDVYAGLGRLGVCVRLIVDKIKDAPELGEVREFFARMEELTPEQRSALMAQFGWVLGPAKQIVEVVDQVSLGE